ncbi:TIGR03086 family metal-binding protein [Streptomyces meridianus]|uniref:TIGR03086 family metal-binding protein n=1 Tax=Streptomyces meridianus TaxID=2938945 RepID=A0ABT0X929_9ACTN|nr:TIGR03086 family metal-binding protein [Streptomyces meridianus]MCM2578924.1 TIGR03086 family metal-binding protein [Streptomyces meridianus]
MTTRISELLEEASGRAVPVVRAVPDDRLGEPTPCTEYTVGQLLDHLFHVVIGFQSLAARQQAEFTVTPHYLEGEWRGRFADETAKLVAAWAAPGADEGVAGSMNLPARTVGAMVLGDLTVHAWDLARATGQAYDPDPSSAGVIEAMVADMAPMARSMKVFGEPVPLPDDAPAFDRLLAATGRDPGWRSERV